MLRTPRRPLLIALACLVGLAVTGVLAYLVPVAQVGDSATLRGFTELNRPRLTPVLDHLAHLCDPGSYAVLGIGIASVALAQRRPRVALLVLGLLFVTGATTERLKPLLASPRYDEWLGSGQIAAASWPSGHATAAMTLALCAVLVAPARLRGTVAALGAGFAVAVSYSVLALGWHFPSDVLGGFLVAAGWTALGVAGLVALERRRPRPVGPATPWRRSCWARRRQASRCSSRSPGPTGPASSRRPTRPSWWAPGASRPWRACSRSAWPAACAPRARWLIPRARSDRWAVRADGGRCRSGRRRAHRIRGINHLVS